MTAARPFPLLLGLLLAAPAAAQGGAGFAGDVGLALFAKRGHVVGRQGQASLMPYGYATWGPAFWRVDTFGVGLLPLGSGALELVGRLDLENATAGDGGLKGLFRGEAAAPLGLGTFQRGAWGGLFAHVYQDVGASRGQLAEGRYAAKLTAARASLYPQVALEWRSAVFNQAYYGVEPGNAEGWSVYRAGASVNPALALAAEVPLSGAWVLIAQVRRKWLGAPVADSPRLSRPTVDSGYLALCYRIN